MHGRVRHRLEREKYPMNGGSNGRLAGFVGITGERRTGETLGQVVHKRAATEACKVRRRNDIRR